MFLKIFNQFIKEFGNGYKLRLFLIAVFSFAMGLLEFFGLALIFPFIMLLAGKNNLLNLPFLSVFINNMADGWDIKSLAFVLCIVIVTIYIFKDIFMILCTKYQNDVMASWQFTIYEELLKKLIQCPYLKLNKLSYGDKTMLLNSSLASSIWNFTHKVILLFSNCIIALCILGFLFYKFALPALFAAVFLGVFVYIEQLYFKQRAKDFGAKLHNLSIKSNNLLEYTMKGIKEIKISKNKDFFADCIIENFKDTNKYSKLLSSNGAYPVYVTEIGIIISFGILAGAIFLLQKTSSEFMVSSLAVVAAVVLRLVPILNKVQSSMFSINQSRNSVVWFLKKTREVKEWTQDEPECKAIPFNNNICLKNANFTYDTENKNSNFNLNNINLEIKKGEFIGIVGLSGSGKTTLIDILTGLYILEDGEFNIDNIKINRNNVRGWHKKIAILPQDFFLMPLSILHNIAFGETKETADFEKIYNALKKAEMYDKVKDNLNNMPELSHGQKHRIALARAFYQDADVLFLDEATSSLDLETEEKVSKTIAKLKGEKTIIAIAHRLSTLKECDAILYMKDGKIIDKGTFKELKEKYPDFENMLELSTFDIS